MKRRPTDQQFDIALLWLAQNEGDNGEAEACDERMVVCETCGGDGSFDRVVGHDPSGPVWQDSFCPTCQGAGEYAVKTEPATLGDISES